LKSLDIEFYKSWPCDSKRRVIRGIEIASNPEKVYPNNTKINLNDVIVLGVDYPREVIRDRITKRLDYRLNHGMIEEIESLLENGLSSKRLEYFGLEYRWVGRYLNQEIDKQTMFEKLNTAIHQFAKRQMTFFRRMQKRGIEIHWIKNGNFQDALKVIEQNK
jgi:tRNA dimethylallyltransferase